MLQNILFIKEESNSITNQKLTIDNIVCCYFNNDTYVKFEVKK